MAGIKDVFSKSIATLNVKTSNFMEENKVKTYIARLESDIAALKTQIGDVMYLDWQQGISSTDKIQELLEGIQEKNNIIQQQEKELERLAQMEKEILGAKETGESENSYMKKPDTIFCTKCGAQNRANYRFCEKCGNALQ